MSSSSDHLSENCLQLLLWCFHQTVWTHFKEKPNELLEPTTEDLLSLSGSIWQFSVCLFFLANVDNLLLHPSFSVWKQNCKISTVNIRFFWQIFRFKEQGLPSRTAILSQRSARRGEIHQENTKSPFYNHRSRKWTRMQCSYKTGCGLTKAGRSLLSPLGNLWAVVTVLPSCT